MKLTNALAYFATALVKKKKFYRTKDLDNMRRVISSFLLGEGGAGRGKEGGSLAAENEAPIRTRLIPSSTKTHSLTGYKKTFSEESFLAKKKFLKTFFLSNERNVFFARCLLVTLNFLG